MKDNEIIKLYWDRDEAAITATADTYGNYCYTMRLNSSFRQRISGTQ